MDPVVVHGGTSRLVCIRCTSSTGPNVSPSVALWSVASENGTHVYITEPWLVSVSGWGEEGGRGGEGGLSLSSLLLPPPPPRLWYYRSNSTAFRDTDGTRGPFFFFFSLLSPFSSFFFFCSIARVDGGESRRRAVYGCESARGRGGEGGRGEGGSSGLCSLVG